jgi:hypothetical protein
MMRKTEAFFAAAVITGLALVALAGIDLPEVDFKKGRAVDPDFNLDLILPANLTQALDVAAGSERGYAFARIGPGRKAALGWYRPDARPVLKILRLPELGGGAKLRCKLKLRTTTAPRISLVVAGRELGRLELPALKAPFRLAFAGGGGVKVAAYQKIERPDAVLFTDNFTRQGAVLGTWKPDRAGTWKINADPHPETSASPFALECARVPRPSMIRAGEHFWDDYRAQVAVNVLESPGGAGLAFNLGAGRGYLLRLLIEGHAAGGAGRAELVRLGSKGTETILAAKPIRGAPGSWYVLELGSVGGQLRAWIDGAELASVPGCTDLVGGQVGLWSSGRSGVRYDDVRIEALQLAAGQFKPGVELDLALRRWVLPAPSMPAYFQQDHTMRSWARIREEYRPGAKGGYWHRARLAGAQEVLWRRPGSPLSKGQLVLALCADGQDFASGYRLVADFGAGGAPAVILSIFQKDKRTAGKVLRLPGTGLERVGFSREAGRLVVRAGSRVVLTAPDKLKLNGGRGGALALGGWRLQRSHLETTAANLLDEVFARAPINWRATTGNWEVASRWKCDPEYTWMLGRQRKGVARLDLKRPVRGDFQLDIHFAVAMSERPAPFYDFPTNLSLGLSPDPERPTSGYAFAFGGIDVPSKIRRAGKTVASGAGLVRPDARASGGGGGIHSHWFHVRVTRKGRRLTLYGDGEKLCEFTDAKPVAGADNLSLWTRNGNGVTMARFRLEASQQLGVRRSPFVSEKTEREKPLPKVFAHFSNRDGRSGARLRASKSEGKGHVLRLENVNSGGTFAAACAPPGGIDLEKDGWLSFNWRTSSGARVNLYVVSGGKFYRAKLTGPARRVGGRWNLRELGTVPGVKAGGSAWQKFSVDLGAALASVEPGLKQLRADEIRIGNYEFEDTALLEGYRGNGPGEWIEIANWKLTGLGPSGSLSQLVVDGPGVKLEKNRFSVKDPRKFSVGFDDLGHAVRYDGAALRYDAFTRRLSFSPRLAGINIPAGESKIKVTVCGEPRPPVFSFKVSYDPRKDKRPPTLPRLISPAPLQSNDFERSLGTWTGFGGLDGAQLILDSRGAKSSARCLLAENRRSGGTIAAMARRSSFDLKRYPTLCFDYRVERYTHVNLLLFTSGARHDITLSDSRGGAYNLGRISGASADGRWHRADIDLHAALRYRRRTIARAIGFADLGPGSSTTQSAYRIDNWIMLPAINGKRAVSFKWRASDESGISGYSAMLDRNRSTVPSTRVSTSTAGLSMSKGLADGTWYLHVRARDVAGNWGETAHWRFKVKGYEDHLAPKVSSVAPAAGASACPRSVEVNFEETGSGVSAHDVELRIGDRVFRPGSPGVAFYPGTGRLRVELTDFAGRLLARPGELKCTVRAADYAGNVMKAHTWTWKLDLAADKAEPAAPRVVFLPSDRVVFQDFERGQGSFANWRRGMSYRQPARSRGGAGLGRWYLATSGRRLHDNNNETQLWPHPIDPHEVSYMAFDYRMKRHTSFDFMIEINNLHYTLGFGPYGAGWSRRLGRLMRTRADGNWHRAEVDLRKMPAKFPKRPDGRLAIIQKILSVSRTQGGADLDNFVLATSYGRDPEFIWDAPQAASGISGYSWKLDGKPDTIPAEKLCGTSLRAGFKGVKPGTHYFHLRARNGAGRWSRVAHQKIVIEKRP